MKVFEFEQGSPEWHSIRAGRPTASNFDMLVTSKGEVSKQRTKYLYRLAGERITGMPEDSYQTLAMIRGNEVEAEAREFYELLRGPVRQVGFCLDDSDSYGASPDGLIGDDGCLEIKCPNLSTHVGYLIEEKLPTEYFQQVQGQLLVTGMKWSDFVSYFPGMKPLIIRVERDEGFIESLKSELIEFCSELEHIVRNLSK